MNKYIESETLELKEKYTDTIVNFDRMTIRIGTTCKEMTSDQIKIRYEKNL